MTEHLIEETPHPNTFVRAVCHFAALDGYVLPELAAAATAGADRVDESAVHTAAEALRWAGRENARVPDGHWILADVLHAVLVDDLSEAAARLVLFADRYPDHDLIATFVREGTPADRALSIARLLDEGRT